MWEDFSVWYVVWNCYFWLIKGRAFFLPHICHYKPRREVQRQSCDGEQLCSLRLLLLCLHSISFSSSSGTSLWLTTSFLFASSFSQWNRTASCQLPWRRRNDPGAFPVASPALPGQRRHKSKENIRKRASHRPFWSSGRGVTAGRYIF